MFASDRKWLAGRSAEHHFCSTSEPLEILLRHITLDYFPVPHVINPAGFVPTQRAAGISVPVENRHMLEARASGAKRKPSSPRKEFKRFQSVLAARPSLERPSRLNFENFRNYIIFKKYFLNFLFLS
jgi:hypothetical protein